MITSLKHPSRSLSLLRGVWGGPCITVATNNNELVGAAAVDHSVGVSPPDLQFLILEIMEKLEKTC